MIPMSLCDIARAVGAAPRAGDEHVRVQRVTTDSRDARPGDLFVAIPGERFDGHRFISDAFARGAVGCICMCGPTGSEGLADAGRRLLVEDSVQALGRLAGHFRRHVMSACTKVIAVTGSNGKTTTKCMLDHVLGGFYRGRAAPKSFNNAIGVPLTLLLAKATDRYLVVEIGSNARGEVDALARIVAPDVAVVTSIGEAHLAGLGDLAAVAAEKASLFDHIRPGGLALANVDRREILRELDRARRVRLMTFGFDRSANLRVSGCDGTIERTTFNLDDRFQVDLPLPGFHHATNAAAVFGVARWMALDPAGIIERLASFSPPEGRTSLVRIGGLTLIDDTYNANPASMTAAINTLSRTVRGQRVMVMGDMLELGCDSAALHRRMVRLVFNSGIETLVAVGAATCDAVSRERANVSSTRVVECADADAACESLTALLCEDDTVWLKGSRLIALDRVIRHLETQWTPIRAREAHRARTVA